MGPAVDYTRRVERIKRSQAIPVTTPDGHVFYVEVNKHDGEMNVTLTTPPGTIVGTPIAVSSVPLKAET